MLRPSLPGRPLQPRTVFALSLQFTVATTKRKEPQYQSKEIKKSRFPNPTHNFPYSALACTNAGISASASFQLAKKSWYAVRALPASPCSAYARANPNCASEINSLHEYKLR